MKKISKLFALAVASILGLAACQQEIAPEKPATATHTVTFVAETPQTKTTVDISDGATAKFAWSKSDENRFTVYEINGETINPATDVVGNLGADNKMTIIAEFAGTATENTSYVAVLNAASIENQISAGTYDENTDVLVSKPVKAWDSEADVLLNFRREIAVAKMTLKGLAEGDEVNNVTIKSDKPLAGTYSVSDWTETSNVINITTEVTANGEGLAEVWFTCIPQEAALFSVEVATAGGKTYTKEFAKPITLTQGNVKAFGVALEEKAEETNAYVKVTTEQSDWTGEYLIVCERAKLAFDSNRDKLNDKPTNGHPSITIDNNQIQATDELRKIAVVIASTEGGYSILAANGNYFDGKTAKNLNESKDPIANTISIDGSANAVIKTGNNQLMYNGNNTSVFRYYANTSQTPIQLYRLENVTPIPVESMNIKGETEVQVGRSIQLTAEINPSNANTGTEMTWSSADESIAKVEPKTGVVTGVAEGKVNITVTSANGMTASCTITVIEPVAGQQTTVDISSFSSVNGTIDDIISYNSFKGDGTTDPAINNNGIRLYQPASGKTYGGYITVSAKNGHTIKSISIKSAQTTSFSYSLDSGTKSAKLDIEQNTEYLLSDISVENISFYCMGTKNNRLQISYIKVVYE